MHTNITRRTYFDGGKDTSNDAQELEINMGLGTRYSTLGKQRTAATPTHGTRTYMGQKDDFVAPDESRK